MKKLVGITLRQEECLTYKETRDQLDIGFYALLKKCEIVPILIPNDETIVKEYLGRIEFSGFIFSGGELPFPYSENMTVRDSVEKILFDYSLKKNLPILGICRGMQVLSIYFGTQLVNVEGHVGVMHKVKTESGEIIVKNSFHNWAVKEGNELIRESKVSEDGVVEAVVNENKRIYGIMWHPERMNIFAKDDVDFIRNIFKE